MYFAQPGTQEQFEGAKLPKNILRQESRDKKGVVVEAEILGKSIYIEMEGSQPTSNHYAIDGKWLLASEFM